MAKITVVGAGYVGTALAAVLADSRSNKVSVLETVSLKVLALNTGNSPIDEPDLTDWFEKKELNLKAFTDAKQALTGADYVFICVPTDFDPATGTLDTSKVEACVNASLTYAPSAVVVIRSTVPVGYTDALSKTLNANLIFCPEFMRETHSLIDHLFPQRIVLGGKQELAESVAKLLLEHCDCPTLFMTNTEAEAVKLLGNAYLATRVAFFNELDTIALRLGLDTKRVLAALCSDYRVGDHYNNPSFGYGGYCLPKDTSELSNKFRDLHLLQALAASNKARVKDIATEVLSRLPTGGTVGVYSLAMKLNSSNSRDSASVSLALELLDRGAKVIVYDHPCRVPSKLCTHPGPILTYNLADFKVRSDLIVTNRLSSDLLDVAEKVFSRDVFNRD